MIFGQFSTMHLKKGKNFNFESNDQMHYADWIFNRYMCDCPHIYHWYICMLWCNREKILSNLFSQGIISIISWYGNVTRVTEMWNFLHKEINPWKLTLKVVILLLLILVLDKIVTISHMSGLFTPNHRVLNFVTRVTNVTRVTKLR